MDFLNIWIFLLLRYEEKNKYDGRIDNGGQLLYKTDFKNLFLFKAVQAQNNKSHFSQCDGKTDLSAMFPTGAIVKVISIYE